MLTKRDPRSIDISRDAADGRKIARAVDKLRRTPSRKATTMSLASNDILKQITTTHASDPEALEPIAEAVVVAKRADGWDDVQIKHYLAAGDFPDFIIQRVLGDVTEVDTSKLTVIQPDIMTMSIQHGQPDIGVSLSTIAGRNRDAYNQSVTPAEIDAAVNGIMAKDRMDNLIRRRPAIW